MKPMGVGGWAAGAIALMLGVFLIFVFVVGTRNQRTWQNAWKYRQVCVEYQIDKPADCAKLGPRLAVKEGK